MNGWIGGRESGVSALDSVPPAQLQTGMADARLLTLKEIGADGEIVGPDPLVWVFKRGMTAREGHFREVQPQTMQDTMQRPKEKPVHEVRIGAIKGAIWKNETANGVRYNVTFSRLYKDKDDDQWKSTDSFGRDDLLVLGKVADTAHTWIHSQGQERETETQS